MNALVRKAISEEVETKYKGAQFWTDAAFNGRITSGDWINVLPTVAQSAGSVNSFTRIGDKITPRGLYVDCYFAIAHTEDRALNMALDVFIVKHRSRKSWLAFNSGTGVGAAELTSALLDSGGAGKFGYTGDMTTALMPVNTDLVKVIKHKRVNLYSSFSPVINEQADSQTRRYVRMTFKVPCPSKLIYDNQLDALNPTNFCPLMAFGFHYPDGTTPVDEVTPLVANVRSRFYYDDA